MSCSSNHTLSSSLGPSGLLQQPPGNNSIVHTAAAGTTQQALIPSSSSGSSGDYLQHFFPSIFISYFFFFFRVQVNMDQEMRASMWELLRHQLMWKMRRLHRRRLQKNHGRSRILVKFYFNDIILIFRGA